jgi:hypothetical protein
MLPGKALTGNRPATIRGLYGYDSEGVWWEQSHSITYRGRRKVDGHRVLIKLLIGCSGIITSHKDWFQIVW